LSDFNAYPKSQVESLLNPRVGGRVKFEQEFECATNIRLTGHSMLIQMPRRVGNSFCMHCILCNSRDPRFANDTTCLQMSRKLLPMVERLIAIYPNDVMICDLPGDNVNDKVNGLIVVVLIFLNLRCRWLGTCSVRGRLFLLWLAATLCSKAKYWKQSITRPEQLRKKGPKFDTSTANKRFVSRGPPLSLSLSLSLSVLSFRCQAVEVSGDGVGGANQLGLMAVVEEAVELLNLLRLLRLLQVVTAVSTMVGDVNGVLGSSTHPVSVAVRLFGFREFISSDDFSLLLGRHSASGESACPVRSWRKERSYHSQAQFHLTLVGHAEPVQIRIRKSSVFNGDGEYSTLFYRNRNGVISEVEFTDEQNHRLKHRERILLFLGGGGTFQPNVTSPSCLFQVVEKLEDCFYTGEVESASNSSFVAVDTCSGLRGAIYYHNTIFVILPLPCPSCDPQTAPHIVLPWPSSPIAQNASIRTFWKPVDLMAMMQETVDHRLADLSGAVHVIWLEFIVDEKLLHQFNGKFTTTLRYVASVVNLVNLHFRDLPVQFHLLRTQIWNLGNRASIESSIKATLNNFQRYRFEQSFSDRAGQLRSRRDLDEDGTNDPLSPSSQGVFKQPASRKADITMLLTDSAEIDFVEGVDHLAIPGSICTPRGTAIVRVNVTDFELRVATLVSKSIAEILGINSILCPEICNENEVFSLGDISRLRLALLSGMSACLRSPNLQGREAFRTDTCGNGIIDRGEECEPHQQGLPIGLPQTTDGSFNKSLNSPAFGCCDPKTCLADIHAPECPGDLYLENGMPCKGERNNDVEEEALCYEGRCPTRSSHCKALWGQNARTADNYCYTTMNRNVDSACGEGAVCEEEDTMCGLLHCQNGSDEPLPVEARSLSFFNLRTQHEQQKIQCQYVASTHKFSYVPEGASCDDGRFCFQNRCIKPTAIVVHSKCPKGPHLNLWRVSDGSSDYIHPAVRRSLPTATTTPINITCSGRGICTNGAFCLCPPGWHGPSCSHQQPFTNPNASVVKPRIKAAYTYVYPDEDIASLIWMYIQAMDKNPEGLAEPGPVNTVYLISILAAVIACVFLCLCGIIFLYSDHLELRSPLKMEAFESEIRRNLNSRGFSFGAKGNRCLPSPTNRLSPALFDSPLSKSAGTATATTTAANSMDSMCLCNRNSRPGGASLDDMELHYHTRHSSRSHRHRHTSSSSSSKNRNRRQKRGGGGASSGDSLQAGANGTVESGPELGRNGEDSVKDEGGNGVGKIKFGSMPSYREDKMKHARDNATSTTMSNTAGISTITDAVVTSTTTTTNDLLQQQQPTLIDFSAPWPLPPPPPPPFVVPAVCSVVATSNPIFVGSPSPWLSTPQTPLSTSTNINTTTTTGTNVICTDVEGMEMGVMSAQPSRKVMTTSTISADETETPQVTVIRENSCRQPEKGILKNKHEGGGGVDMPDLTTSTNGEGSGKKRKHSSKRSSKKRRCSSPHFSGAPSSTSSSSTSTTGSRSPSASSTGSSSSSLSSVSSCSTSRATDDTNSTNFVASVTHSGDEEEGGVADMLSDSGSTCSTALETGEEDRKASGRKCRHKNHRHRKSQCKKKSNHRQHGHGHSHHHHHSHSHHRRRQRSSSTGGETSATNTSTPPTTTTASTSSTSSPCHRRCHRRRRTGFSRRYRLSSEDAESSIGGQNHKVPTILCNAEQQTDEISLNRVMGVVFPTSQKDLQAPSSSKDLQNANNNNLQQQQQLTSNVIDEEDSEWEEVECTGGSDCEECRKSAAISSWNASAVPPTPPSAGGLLSRQHKLPSPPPLPPAIVTSTPYYCTTQLSSQPEINPYYQPPIEDMDSFVAGKSGFVSHLKYSGHAEEDDGLISSRGTQGGLTLTPSLNAPTDCYMTKDSDGLTRKASPGVPYISRRNYNGSDSDFSLSTSVKKSPTLGHTVDWLSSGNSSQAGGLGNHVSAAVAATAHQWLDVAESDASSLPDASCDLVHLAQLSHAARMNPNLSDLARQQERIRLGTEAPFYSKQP
uniref:Peptidase M12B domain-containing protein n=1 Tax=Taenia asiatica TaxID=60517 RepID=A0A158R6U9_TAEAS